MVGTVKNLQQPARGVEGVIVAKISVGEKQMAAHFPCQRRLFFIEFLLNERMARHPHNGFAAMLTDVID